ncbi:MAG TPA: hypothetical protein VFG08_04195, partial [Candidatus Polarisedimenticolia bacterium]|nr:hypothetical protein [Candidatus Polarisedimenticolia bacterium]
MAWSGVPWRPSFDAAAKSVCLVVLLAIEGFARPSIQAGVTSLLLDSEPGEFIGDGKFYFYTPADGILAPSPIPPPPGFPEYDVRLSFSNISLREFWIMGFSAPVGETLAVGVYDNAVPLVRRAPDQPALDVHGNARLCINTFGRFDVKQVGFDAGGALEAFWATFEQTCTGAVLRGEVRYNADVPVVLGAPSRLNVIEERHLSFGVEGFDTDGHPVTLTAGGLPPGARFEDAMDGTGRYDWTPGIGQAGLYWFATQGRSIGGDTDTVYTRVEAFPDFDEFDRAIPFSTLPFMLRVDDPEASRAADDPICLDPPQEAAWGTVWYAFTPLDDVRVHAGSMSLSPALSVYTGERGALEQVTCNPRFARFDATAGSSYYIMVGTPAPESALTFRAEALPPPPANDDFDSATVVDALPFGDIVDTSGAIADQDDPGPCGSGTRAPNVWYAYTPAQDTRVTIDTVGSSYRALVAVFSGPPEVLVPGACTISRLSFTARAGMTYHVMIADPFPSTIGSLLQVAFTGAPAVDIEVTVDPDGRFDPHSGAATIHGTAGCSRPAAIVVSGIVEQGNQKVRGAFEALVTCGGASGWEAEVIPDPAAGSRHQRFSGGPAMAVVTAFGVPEDNPDDRADA